MLARVVMDPLAYTAIGFLILTVLITLGLGVFVVSHMSKKKKKSL